jgi:hypothetical protein
VFVPSPNRELHAVFLPVDPLDDRTGDDAVEESAGEPLRDAVVAIANAELALLLLIARNAAVG